MSFPRWPLRVLRWSLIGLVGLVLLGGVFVVVENLRGERAWREYAARCAAAGDPVDVFPSPSTLPPEHNFMKTPLLDRLLFAKEGSAELKEFESDTMGPVVTVTDANSWRRGEWLDLGRISGQPAPSINDVAAMRVFYAAGVAAVRESLVAMDAALEELRAAARTRLESQLVHPQAMVASLPPDIPAPRFKAVRRVATALALHASVALAEGRDDEALADVVVGLRFARGFGEAPDSTLVDSMIGIVCAHVAVQPLWEGIQRHAWGEEQLFQLQRELALLAPVRSLERSFRVERTFVVHALQNVPVSKLVLPEHNGGETLPRWAIALRVVPGWVQHSRIAAAKEITDRIIVLGKRATPGFLGRLGAEGRRQRAEGEARNILNVLASPVVPAFDTVTGNALVAENNVALTVTVCALERYRLAHGGYPDTLAELAPAYLDAVPLDVIDGQPLRYRRLADGAFKLYSVGLNGTDDDGALSDWKTDEGRRSGDWCWPQPAK